MKTVTKYIANDGTEFNDEQECLDYEWEKFVYPFVKENVSITFAISEDKGVTVGIDDEMKTCPSKFFDLLEMKSLHSFALNCDMPFEIHEFIGNCGFNVPNEVGYYLFDEHNGWEKLCG